MHAVIKLLVRASCFGLFVVFILFLHADVWNEFEAEFPEITLKVNETLFFWQLSLSSLLLKYAAESLESK